MLGLYRTDDNEQSSLVERWRFGKILLEMRQGMKRLPNGVLAELVEETGKSTSEFTKRMQFAEKYTTEDELRNALRSSPFTWFDFCNPKLPAKKSRQPVPKLPPWSEDDWDDEAVDNSRRLEKIHATSFRRGQLALVCAALSYTAS